MNRDHAIGELVENRVVWTDFDISVPAPLTQMRLIGAAMCVIAMGGVLIVLKEAVR
jgi:hypothetical protein